MFDIGRARVQNLQSSDFLFLGGGWLPFLNLASLHNLHKDWDIGFKVGIFDIGGQGVGYWTSFSIATYGYYYPFEKRYFIRFGLENNIPYDLLSTSGHGAHTITPDDALRHNDEFEYWTAFSFGLGFNHNNDNYLLHIAISVPFYNKYPRRNIYHPDARLHYVITGGVTWLFI